MEANDFGGCDVETNKDIAGGNLEGQMGVDPDWVLEVKGDSRFALFRKRVAIRVSPFPAATHASCSSAFLVLLAVLDLDVVARDFSFFSKCGAPPSPSHTSIASSP